MNAMKVNARKLQDLKIMVIYSTLGLGTTSGLFLLARHFYKKVQVKQSEKHSLEEGDPATFAKQLKMAFDNDNSFGWGTNEEVIIEVFKSIPSKSMYSKVQREYSKMYGKSLNVNLEEELSSEEYNELIRVLNAKK